MDKLTRNYRRVEFEAVPPAGEFKTILKIRHGEGLGETKWISITDAELAAIKEILLGGKTCPSPAK